MEVLCSTGPYPCVVSSTVKLSPVLWFECYLKSNLEIFWFLSFIDSEADPLLSLGCAWGCPGLAIAYFKVFGDIMKWG